MYCLIKHAFIKNCIYISRTKIWTLDKARFKIIVLFLFRLYITIKCFWFSIYIFYHSINTGNSQKYKFHHDLGVKGLYKSGELYMNNCFVYARGTKVKMSCPAHEKWPLKICIAIEIYRWKCKPIKCNKTLKCVLNFLRLFLLTRHIKTSHFSNSPTIV